MYFASRLQAGRMLAEKLTPQYRYENCAIMALSDGGVMVGAQLAMQLHCVLTLLLNAEITLPRETDPLAGITTEGTFTYNPRYSSGEIEEMAGEYRNMIEQKKIEQMHRMNKLLGSGGTIKRELLRGHNVIVVSDGMPNGFDVDLAYQFLKTIAIEKLIFATPLASIHAIDRMHVLADELYCLDVLEEMRETDHYYDKNDMPEHEKVVEVLEHIILKWK